MKNTFLAALTASTLAAPALADPQTFTIDPSHAQATFTYDHIGLSTTSWIIGGFEGEIVLDRDDLGASQVTASIPTANLFSGWADRDGHILNSGDFFDLGAHSTASFTSTAVEVTGETTANVTGDLTLNGMTKPIVLDVTFNGELAEYPIPPFNGKPAVGFTATGSFKRTDFGIGQFAPFISDDVTMIISVEAMDLS